MLECACVGVFVGVRGGGGEPHLLLICHLAVHLSQKFCIFFCEDFFGLLILSGIIIDRKAGKLYLFQERGSFPFILDNV
jgi:hypothetical protein